MRDLSLDEIGHVYGAGNQSDCSPGKSECAPGHTKDDCGPKDKPDHKPKGGSCSVSYSCEPSCKPSCN